MLLFNLKPCFISNDRMPYYFLTYISLVWKQKSATAHDENPNHHITHRKAHLRNAISLHESHHTFHMRTNNTITHPGQSPSQTRTNLRSADRVTIITSKSIVRGKYRHRITRRYRHTFQFLKCQNSGFHTGVAHHKDTKRTMAVC